MAKGILLVTSDPVSPEREDEFNEWYEKVHVPEVTALDGFTGATRYRVAADDGLGRYVCIYQIDADDVVLAQKALGEAIGAGKLNMSDVVKMDPRPQMRLLEQL